jgi:hypothetical protein
MTAIRQWTMKADILGDTGLSPCQSSSLYVGMGMSARPGWMLDGRPKRYAFHLSWMYSVHHRRFRTDRAQFGIRQREQSL